MRIAQMVVTPVGFTWVVGRLGKTDRGTGGSALRRKGLGLRICYDFPKNDLTIEAVVTSLIIQAANRAR